ncbi:telomere-protecting terminal protein Tpg [Kitasatospora sp. NPDC006697]|uniref:telomere-protecting terminal protein Tpg n=1 Tax=Kitasatospora sp. NPDC006697 TaxID=3364020 RepID=UPI0036C16F1C
MGEIDESLERVERTRPLPVHFNTRLKFLWEKVAKEDTAKLAEAVGVSVRTAQRWVHALRAVAAGEVTGDVPMSKANAAKVEQAVRRRWQPGVRRRTRRRAETQGLTVTLNAYLGFDAAGRSTDEPRLRTITQRMPGEVARRLYQAHDAGRTQAEQERILAEAFQEHYFKQGGRAQGLQVVIRDLGWMDVEL